MLLNNTKIKDYDIIEGTDGIDILKEIISDQANGNKIKLIITDENMEYMCGSSAISLVREFEKQNKIQKYFICSLTAFEDTETKKDIINKGADIVLSKPISAKVLDNLIDSVF